MGKFGALVKWVILLPILIVALLLAVANDQIVTVHLNPFDTGDPVLRVDLALYQIAFILFVFGALIGAMVVWGGQRRHRRAVRYRGDDAAFENSRADRPVRPKETQRPASTATAYLPRPERS